MLHYMLSFDINDRLEVGNLALVTMRSQGGGCFSPKWWQGGRNVCLKIVAKWS